jgi:hypothetical protein
LHSFWPSHRRDFICQRRREPARRARVQIDERSDTSAAKVTKALMKPRFQDFQAQVVIVHRVASWTNRDH